MKLTFTLHPPPPPSVSPHISIRYSSSRVPSCFNTNQTSRVSMLQPRDRVMEFGKHKGKMLGTLSSDYLLWMSKNLGAGDREEWGRLAGQVLEDEVYVDRLDWEQAERLLTGAGAAADLKEMSERLGWDNDDKVGWSKVDFRLLGTSKGGRIPRIGGGGNDTGERSLKKGVGKGVSVGREKRRERRRQRLVVCEEKEETDDNDDNGRKEGRNRNRNRKTNLLFPGRQSLVKKVFS